MDPQRAKTSNAMKPMEKYFLILVGVGMLMILACGVAFIG
jgi:hypothetical protein